MANERETEGEEEVTSREILIAIAISAQEALRDGQKFGPEDILGVLRASNAEEIWTVAEELLEEEAAEESGEDEDEDPEAEELDGEPES